MRITSRPLPPVLGVFASAAALFAALTASSAPPATSASGDASATATAAGAPSATPSGSAAADSRLPEIRGADIPEGKSDPPKIAEWEAGKRVRPHRRVGGPCKLVVVREWLRIQCDEIIGGTLVAGDPTDVKVVSGGGSFIPPNPEDPRTMDDPLARTDPPAKTLFTMRLRRGETKVFSLLSAYKDYFVRPFEAGYLSVSWPAHREDPVILASNGAP
jgi:hypothetical protein